MNTYSRRWGCVTDEDILALAEEVWPHIACSAWRITYGDLVIEWTEDAILQFARAIEARVTTQALQARD
jgi:hypothetical protein